MSSTPPLSLRALVLVVDDVPDNLLVVGDLLREAGYAVRAATSGPVALRYAAQSPRPDLVLLDVAMPGMDGYEVLRHLQDNPDTADIPVVLLSGRGEDADEEHGLALGAADYLSKPIRPLVALARVRTQIDAHRTRRALAQENRELAMALGERMAERLLTRRVGLRALAHLAELRDPETGNHLLRTQGCVKALATSLMHSGHCPGQLDERTVELLAEAAPLHDIGKIGIPDRILLKPGSLDDDEWAIMRTHTTIGAQAIELAEKEAHQSIEFLALARQIAQSHHERWDGSGYPEGLAGEDIPLAARIMAVADVFDALVSPRVYKRAVSTDQAWHLIVSGSGSQFDPAVVWAFAQCFDQLCAIERRLAEPEPEPDTERITEWADEPT